MGIGRRIHQNFGDVVARPLGMGNVADRQQCAPTATRVAVPNLVVLRQTSSDVVMEIHQNKLNLNVALQGQTRGRACF